MQIAVQGAEPLRRGACQVMAEAGANHNNSVDRAIELVERAAAAGAWGVKFQLYKADSLSVPDAPKYWSDPFGTGSQHEAFKLSDRLAYSDFERVSAAARKAGIVFFATPFDVEAIEALERMRAPIYKIASGDITHRPLLEAVAATGKPMILSTGGATVEEIRNAIEWTGLGPERLVLLVCTLTYPTPDEDGNFARIPTFEREFDPYLIGTSDHTLGTAGAWMTAALGGVCIEKHYTLDRGLPDVPDHAMSVEPAQLAEMVEACNRGAVLAGDSTIGVRPSEEPARANARRSVVLVRDLAAGEVVSQSDVGFKRPGTGIPPSDVDRVVGSRLTVGLPSGAILRYEDLQEAAGTS